jgi:hypothetical protein
MKTRAKEKDRRLEYLESRVRDLESSASRLRGGEPTASGASELTAQRELWELRQENGKLRVALRAAEEEVGKFSDLPPCLFSVFRGTDCHRIYWQLSRLRSPTTHHSSATRPPRYPEFGYERQPSPGTTSVTESSSDSVAPSRSASSGSRAIRAGRACSYSVAERLSPSGTPTPDTYTTDSHPRNHIKNHDLGWTGLRPSKRT